MIRKTLIIEDSKTFRNAFRDALHEKYPSMMIRQAVDARSAMETLNSFMPDVIFMDIRLPDENGIVLTEKIKKQYPVITVIILTDYDLPEYRDAAAKGNADHFIPKGKLQLSHVEQLLESLGG